MESALNVNPDISYMNLFVSLTVLDAFNIAEKIVPNAEANMIWEMENALVSKNPY